MRFRAVSGTIGFTDNGNQSNDDNRPGIFYQYRRIHQHTDRYEKNSSEEVFYRLYDMIYTAPLNGSGSTMEQLETLYKQFNLQKPVEVVSKMYNLSLISLKF